MLIQTREQFDSVRTTLLNAPVIAVDTETNGLYPHLGNRLIGISMTCNLPIDPKYRLSVYFPFRHDPKSMDLFTVSENLPVEWIKDLKPVLERSDVQLIFHNFKFDARILKADGISITERTRIWDTMVMSHMSDENKVHSLKGQAAERWGEDAREEERETKKLIKKRGGWDKVSAAELEPYACKDTELTFDLWRELLDELSEQDLMQLWPQKEEFLHCLKLLEFQGIELDVELARERRLQTERRMRELESQLGFDPLKLDNLAHILYGAPPGGLGLHYSETSDTSTSEFPNGRPKMGEHILARIDHPIARNVLEYRGLVKANSTWWKGYLQKADPSNRIHPEYATSDKKEKFGTVTGRLSSSNPNIQQMPRDKSTPVKKLLIPPTGWSMWELDYAQVELRLAACYARDPLYIEAFRAGVDAHQATADAMGGVDRQAAKHASFCILYGGQWDTLQATIERLHYLETGELISFPEQEAKDILNTYYQVHPSLKQVADQATMTVRLNGFVKLWNGAKRHFNETETFKHKKSGQWMTRGNYPFAYKAFNSVIQGGAAALMEETMLRAYRKYRDSKATVPWRMVLQVHDSLWFEVEEETGSGLITEESTILELKELMEWPGQMFEVPFPVEEQLVRRRELEVKEDDESGRVLLGV